MVKSRNDYIIWKIISECTQLACCCQRHNVISADDRIRKALWSLAETISDRYGLLIDPVTVIDILFFQLNAMFFQNILNHFESLDRINMSFGTADIYDILNTVLSYKVLYKISHSVLVVNAHIRNVIDLHADTYDRNIIIPCFPADPLCKRVIVKESREDNNTVIFLVFYELIDIELTDIKHLGLVICCKSDIEMNVEIPDRGILLKTLECLEGDITVISV